MAHGCTTRTPSRGPHVPAPPHPATSPFFSLPLHASCRCDDIAIQSWGGGVQQPRNLGEPHCRVDPPSTLRSRVIAPITIVSGIEGRGHPCILNSHPFPPPPASKRNRQKSSLGFSRSTRPSRREPPPRETQVFRGPTIERAIMGVGSGLCCVCPRRAAVVALGVEEDFFFLFRGLLFCSQDLLCRWSRMPNAKPEVRSRDASST